MLKDIVREVFKDPKDIKDFKDTRISVPDVLGVLWVL
jgi:hypothetical protein